MCLPLVPADLINSSSKHWGLPLGAATCLRPPLPCRTTAASHLGFSSTPPLRDELLMGPFVSWARLPSPQPRLQPAAQSVSDRHFLMVYQLCPWLHRWQQCSIRNRATIQPTQSRCTSTGLEGSKGGTEKGGELASALRPGTRLPKAEIHFSPSPYFTLSPARPETASRFLTPLTLCTPAVLQGWLG